VLLKQIRLERFKAYDKASIDAAQVTVLIGPNNGGKSTVLQPLALLAQTLATNTTGRLKVDGPYVDLGQDLAELGNDSAGAPASSWEVGLTWNAPAFQAMSGAAPDIEIDFDLIARAQQFPQQSFTTQANVRRQIPVGRWVEATVAYGEQKMRVQAPDLRGTGASPIQKIGRDYQVSANTHWEWRFMEKYPVVVDETDDTRKSDRIIATLVNDAVPFFQGGIAHQLQAFHYVGPNRQVVRSLYPLGGFHNANPQTAEEVVNELAYGDAILSRVSERLRGVFPGYGIDKSVFRAADFRAAGQGNLVALRGVIGSRRRNLVHMGGGFSQFAWVALQLELAQLFIPQYPDAPLPTPIVGVEEPELHLHPKLQPAMARLLADFAVHNQVICTTQSEHFLLAVLELVLDGTLSPEQVSVIYLDASAGEVDRLEVDSRGQLKGGLKGFFEANERQIERQVELLRKSAGLGS